MKFLFFLFLGLTLSLNSKAQQVLNAGNDFIYCVPALGRGLSIPLNAVYSGSTPIQKIAWRCRVASNGFTWISNAKQILNDTTIINPILAPTGYEIINTGLGYTQVIPLVLEVTDINNIKYIDTINIKISNFAYIPDPRVKNITIGNSVRLDCFTGGGQRPLTYSWTPNYNINDTTAQYPIVSPLVNTTYTLVVTDAGGCKSLKEDWVVKVWPLSTESGADEKLIVFPNPINKGTVIRLPKGREGLSYRFSLMDIQGKLLYASEMTKNEIEIESLVQGNGLFIYRIEYSDKVRYTGKILKE
jgi:hypothetical protein